MNKCTSVDDFFGWAVGENLMSVTTYNMLRNIFTLKTADMSNICYIIMIY